LCPASLQQSIWATIAGAAAAEGIGLSKAIPPGPCRRRPWLGCVAAEGRSRRSARSSPTRSSAFDRPGLCDMAAGEAETCLGKLTTLRSYRAGPRAIERHQNSTKRMGGNVTRPRAADDFATIRARLEELRQEREAVHATEGALDQPGRYARTPYWSQREISTGPGRVRQSGPTGG
jgi:hypothetical protein